MACAFYCGETGHQVSACPLRRTHTVGTTSQRVSITSTCLPSRSRTTPQVVIRWREESTGVDSQAVILLTLNWLGSGEIPITPLTCTISTKTLGTPLTYITSNTEFLTFVTSGNHTEKIHLLLIHSVTLASLNTTPVLTGRIIVL